MNQTMYEINGSYYVLNLRKINSYIFETQEQENYDIETTDQYSIANNGLTPVRTGREIKSVKTNGNLNTETLKYDMFKQMLVILIDGGIDDDDWQNLSNSEKLIINTFINEGFLEEIIIDNQ